MHSSSAPAGFEWHKNCDEGGSIFRPTNGAVVPAQACLPVKRTYTFPTLPGAIADAARKCKGEHVASWVYSDESGNESFVVARFSVGDGKKEFRPFHHNGAGYLIADPPGLLPLYQIPSLRNADRVYVTEGEKAAEAAREIGLVATTSAHGSKCAKKSDWSPLAGKHVFILVDNDADGEKYGVDAVRLLLALDPSTVVKIVRLPDLPQKGDIVEFIEARRGAGASDDDIRKEIEAFADGAPRCEQNAVQPDEIGEHTTQSNSLQDTDRERWRIIPASQLAVAKAETEWIVENLIPAMHITLFSALWKSGKTTFLAWLLRGMDQGGHLVGRIRGGRVLVVTEESSTLWTMRIHSHAYSDSIMFTILPFMVRPTRTQWEAYLAFLTAHVRADKINLIIFDTIVASWSCPDENDASKVQQALGPMRMLTEAGATVILVHHVKKGDGSEATASRGSGAIPSFVDNVIEMRRYAAEDRQDTRRVLTTYGRFHEIPPEVVIELTEDGYRTLGAKTDATRQDRQTVIKSMLDDLPDGEKLTAKQLLERWPKDAAAARPGVRALEGELKSGAEAGLWQRSGRGVSGDSYRYSCRAPIDPPACATRQEDPESHVAHAPSLKDARNDCANEGGTNGTAEAGESPSDETSGSNGSAESGGDA